MTPLAVISQATTVTPPPPPPPGSQIIVLAPITDTGWAVYPWGTSTTNVVITDTDPTEIGRITEGAV